MALEKLAVSIQYLLHHWGCMNEYGKALRCLFELIQLETGLEGNFLLQDYDTYECLPTHSWFKILWEYLEPKLL